MKIKELREALAKIPAEYDDAQVYAYSHIDEGADDVGSVKVYNKETFENNEGTPYCGGDAPWDITEKDGGWYNTGWDGTVPFVIVG